MTKPATGWKAMVLERHPRAVVWSKRDQPNSGQSFRCYADPDGRAGRFYGIDGRRLARRLDQH